MYAEKITKVADEIKEIRKELYLKKYIDSDEIREKIDNILFEMQSKLRYNIATILKDYEELKEMDSKKCIKYKQGSICRVTCQTMKPTVKIIAAIFFFIHCSSYL